MLYLFNIKLSHNFTINLCVKPHNNVGLFFISSQIRFPDSASETSALGGS